MRVHFLGTRRDAADLATVSVSAGGRPIPSDHEHRSAAEGVQHSAQSESEHAVFGADGQRDHPARAGAVEGDATAEDRIVTDISSPPELAPYFEQIFARQPAGKIWSSWLGRRILPGYYMRILIYVTPRRALFWPDRDFSKAPEELDPEVLRGVG